MEETFKQLVASIWDLRFSWKATWVSLFWRLPALKVFLAILLGYLEFLTIIIQPHKKPGKLDVAVTFPNHF